MSVLRVTRPKDHLRGESSVCADRRPGVRPSRASITVERVSRLAADRAHASAGRAAPVGQEVKGRCGHPQGGGPRRADPRDGQARDLDMQAPGERTLAPREPRRQPPARRATRSTPERERTSMANRPGPSRGGRISRNSERWKLVSQRCTGLGSAETRPVPVAGSMTAAFARSPSNHQAVILPDGDA